MNENTVMQPHRPRWRVRTVRGGKWIRERGQKGLSSLPHLFTLANLSFGIGSLLLTMDGQWRAASLMVVGSLIADGLDGRLARLMKAEGAFGRELDSLADVVAFGVAPAVLLYQMGLRELGYLGLAVTLFFPLCGALRLARFNILTNEGYFLGVPITAAGTLLSTMAFYFLQETTAPPPPHVIPSVMVILGYLMTSSIPYPDFKKRRKSAGVQFWPIVGPVLALAALLFAAGWNPWAVILMPLTAYVVLGPWLVVLRKWDEKVQPWLADVTRR
ncbi:CDP-diacylglycerol--serine O-phosphatidyltransferase [Symbiobacterium thermophilum]|uniref:CDP-diacylglycerol--serine O-phosphatidyltransferase n=2 Tax=Symbiobacterium thermophilum TaxID=2734 RepID=A0A953I0A8_SYMTR|nr:CDP-diacylglycerol--serine O-phosphatidyltransferase [Symbiobacterium thermophilum]MBY6274666.1 CDP-diacylglycerol--serine O-phosphatidyltransferase [Symbiobacterium thermophilum]